MLIEGDKTMLRRRVNSSSSNKETVAEMNSHSLSDSQKIHLDNLVNVINSLSETDFQRFINMDPRFRGFQRQRRRSFWTYLFGRIKVYLITFFKSILTLLFCLSFLFNLTFLEFISNFLLFPSSFIFFCPFGVIRILNFLFKKFIPRRETRWIGWKTYLVQIKLLQNFYFSYN